MNTTTDLADFGHRERSLLITLLQAWNDTGLPDDFSDDGVYPMANTGSGKVFLTNENCEVAMMNGDALESFYTTPHEGREGFFSELAVEYADMHVCDQQYMRELAETLGRTSELPEQDDEESTDDEGDE